jgi:hypothetical protein
VTSTATHNRRADASIASKERVDFLDVVADMGDQGNVGGRRRRHRPARRDDAHVREPVVGHPLPEHALHPLRRLDGDDLPSEQRQRKGVAAAAGADVKPRFSGLTSERSRSSAGSSVRRGSARKSDATGA